MKPTLSSVPSQSIATTWRLYNAKTKEFYEAATSADLANILKTNPSDKVNKWFVLKDGELDWIPLYTLTDELKSFLNVAQEPPAKVRLPLTPASQQACAPVHLDVFENIEATENRRGLRKKITIKTILNVDGQIFETFTINVSLMGLKIDLTCTKWPETKTVEVSLWTANGIIDLVCVPLEELHGLGWNRLKILPGKNIGELVTLLSKPWVQPTGSQIKKRGSEP